MIVRAVRIPFHRGLMSGSRSRPYAHMTIRTVLFWLRPAGFDALRADQRFDRLVAESRPPIETTLPARTQ